jgi:hypothetical protein
MRHAAGVDDDSIGLAEGVDDVVTGGTKAAGDGLAIGEVELAAKGEDGGEGSRLGHLLGW